MPDGDANSVPSDISDDGDIVGHSGGLSDTGEENSEDTDAPVEPVFWEECATEGVEIDIEDNDFVLEGLTGITEDGTIVGSGAGTPEGPSQPWIGDRADAGVTWNKNRLSSPSPLVTLARQLPLDAWRKGDCVTTQPAPSAPHRTVRSIQMTLFDR